MRAIYKSADAYQGRDVSKKPSARVIFRPIPCDTLLKTTAIPDELQEEFACKFQDLVGPAPRVGPENFEANGGLRAENRRSVTSWYIRRKRLAGRRVQMAV